jgi:hypothetical protein
MADLSWLKQRKLLRAPNIGFNAEVFRHFKVFDETPGRLVLRDSLLIGAKDSRTTALFKIQYFRDQVQKVHLSPVVIGVPKEQFDIGIEVKYKPIVQLYFQQDRGAVVEDYSPVTAEICFRLMNESTETITRANLETLAKKIKSEFALGQGYTFNKGKTIVHYNDRAQGYSLQLYVINEAEGIDVVKKVLGIQNHTYNDEFLRKTEPKKSSVNATANQTIAGKTYKKQRWRPTATVRFQWASLLIQGTPDATYLVDRTLSLPFALEQVY